MPEYSLHGEDSDNRRVNKFRWNPLVRNMIRVDHPDPVNPDAWIYVIVSPFSPPSFEVSELAKEHGITLYLR